MNFTRVGAIILLYLRCGLRDTNTKQNLNPFSKTEKKYPKARADFRKKNLKFLFFWVGKHKVHTNCDLRTWGQTKNARLPYHPRLIYINSMYCLSFEDLQYISKHNKCYIQQRTSSTSLQNTAYLPQSLAKTDPTSSSYISVWTTAAYYSFKQTTIERNHTDKSSDGGKSGNEENSKKIFLFYPLWLSVGVFFLHYL